MWLMFISPTIISTNNNCYFIFVISNYYYSLQISWYLFSIFSFSDFKFSHFHIIFFFFTFNIFKLFFPWHIFHIISWKGPKNKKFCSILPVEHMYLNLALSEGRTQGCPYPTLNVCKAGPEQVKNLGGPILPRPLPYPRRTVPSKGLKTSKPIFNYFSRLPPCIKCQPSIILSNFFGKGTTKKTFGE